MSSLRAFAWLSPEGIAPMAMRGVSAPGLADGRHDSSQHEDAADGVVLGRLSGGHGQTRDLGPAAPTPAGAASV